ncbi:MAG: hypothetical protein AAF799_25650 [Myxococcota bacterium]
MELLRRAFPSGIPECDLLPLMAVLGDAGMSNRSVAAAVGYYYGKDSTAFSYQAHICTVDETVSDLTKFAIREYLRKFGFDDWVASST